VTGEAVTCSVEVHPTVDALIRAAADAVVGAAAAAVGQTGRFVLALSGGSTPRELYRLLAAPAYAARIEWPRTDVFWGDERCVPPDDPASNYRMAREALLDHVAVSADRVHRVRGEEDPHAAAAAYEKTLRHVFATPIDRPRVEPATRFDLVLLGMGGDGHTASLFPGSPGLRERDRWVVADRVNATPPWRVTLTLPVINAATELVFLVAGADKATPLQRVLEGPRAAEPLPAQLVAPTHGRLRWLVDRAAAARLARHG
jgi:6-phosphogluconolactonase